MTSSVSYVLSAATLAADRSSEAVHCAQLCSEFSVASQAVRSSSIVLLLADEGIANAA